MAATIWSFDPNYSLPNVTKVGLPNMFQIANTWLQLKNMRVFEMLGACLLYTSDAADE